MVVTNLQRQRRTDPYPWTWEPAAGAATLLVVLMLLGVHAGRALATAVTGHGFTWPTTAHLITSLPAVLAGDPTAGLPPGTLPRHTVDIHTNLLYAAIGAVEILILTGSVLATWWTLSRHGPGRMQGMANRAQAERLLGITRLRANRHIIRPDLNPTRQTRPRPARRTRGGPR